MQPIYNSYTLLQIFFLIVTECKREGERRRRKKGWVYSKNGTSEIHLSYTEHTSGILLKKAATFAQKLSK
jgi:hypothetical protein